MASSAGLKKQIRTNFMVLAKSKARSLLFNRRADCTKYAYDSAGNRNNTSQSITTGNRLASDATYTYTYDDEGNLTSKVSIASPTVTWTYSWDVNNRLTAIDKSGGGTSLYNISYKYDVFGSRIEQVEDADGAGGGASATTRFAVEGSKVMQDAWGNRTAPIGTEYWNVWADLNGSNALQVRYVRGDATDELFSRVKSDGTVASYLTDRMQSVRQMVDTSGAVQDTISYDGFGNVLSESNASFGDRWKWTGREYNASTGLQYNRARYFSADSGRWINEDPMRTNAGDYNISRYLSNSTTSYLDPSGLGSGHWVLYYLDERGYPHWVWIPDNPRDNSPPDHLPGQCPPKTGTGPTPGTKPGLPPPGDFRPIPGTGGGPVFLPPVDKPKPGEQIPSKPREKRLPPTGDDNRRMDGQRPPIKGPDRVPEFKDFDEYQGWRFRQSIGEIPSTHQGETYESLKNKREAQERNK